MNGMIVGFSSGPAQDNWLVFTQQNVQQQRCLKLVTAGRLSNITTLHKIYYRTHPRKKAYALVAAMAPSETAVTT